MREGGQRAHLGTCGIRQIDLERTRHGAELGDHFVVHAALHEGARAGHAGLAAAFKNTTGQSGDGGVHGRIVEHDVRRLAAQLQRHGHELAGRGFGNPATALGAAGERHHAHARVLDQCRTDLLTGARQHVQDARRQARLLGDFGQQQTGGRRDFGGLENHRVACGQCRRDLLRLHRHGRVPRRDGGDHAIGLVDRHRQIVAACRSDLGASGLAHGGVVAEGGGGALHLGLALAPDLAVFNHLQTGQLLAAALHAIGDAGQDGGACGRQHVAPLLVTRGLVGHAHRGVCGLGTRGGDLVIHLPGGRIHRHQGRNAGVAIYCLATDPHLFQGAVRHLDSWVWSVW